jgi:hypothetical protein
LPPATFPTPLSAYATVPGESLAATLAGRLAADPFNGVATAIFFCAILHTFAAARFTTLAHRIRQRHAHRGIEPASPSVAAELLHFLGEVEVVFGLWAVVLLAAITVSKGWNLATHYVNDVVNYTEPLFVVVVMSLAATRPIVLVAEGALRRVARIGGGSPAAWWLSILTIGPLLGSLITEPAAMTIAAMLLARRFFDLGPSEGLKYATLGLLFVNVSVGGALTAFAAPPILMVARPWGWDSAYLLGHFGWRAALAIVVANLLYFARFRAEFRSLALLPGAPDRDVPEEAADGAPVAPLLPVPAWLTIVHGLFLAWTVFNAHYPALFLGGFLIFLGFARATAAYQSRIELRAPLLVGFFLAGLVIHGGLQAWWIGPVLRSLSEELLFFGAAFLTSFNDNALITYLATLVPTLSEPLKVAVVGGAIAGGGLTVIANAPNPAGQSLLSRFFGGAVSPLRLFLAALPPTLVVALAFRAL